MRTGRVGCPFLPNAARALADGAGRMRCLLLVTERDGYTFVVVQSRTEDEPGAFAGRSSWWPRAAFSFTLASQQLARTQPLHVYSSFALQAVGVPSMIDEDSISVVITASKEVEGGETLDADDGGVVTHAGKGHKYTMYTVFVRNVTTGGKCVLLRAVPAADRRVPVPAPKAAALEPRGRREGAHGQPRAVPAPHAAVHHGAQLRGLLAGLREHRELHFEVVSADGADRDAVPDHGVQAAPHRDFAGHGGEAAAADQSRGAAQQELGVHDAVGRRRAAQAAAQPAPGRHGHVPSLSAEVDALLLQQRPGQRVPGARCRIKRRLREPCERPTQRLDGRQRRQSLQPLRERLEPLLLLPASVSHGLVRMSHEWAPERRAVAGLGRVAGRARGPLQQRPVRATTRGLTRGGLAQPRAAPRGHQRLCAAGGAAPPRVHGAAPPPRRGRQLSLAHGAIVAVRQHRRALCERPGGRLAEGRVRHGRQHAGAAHRHPALGRGPAPRVHAQPAAVAAGAALRCPASTGVAACQLLEGSGGLHSGTKDGELQLGDSTQSDAVQRVPKPILDADNVRNVVVPLLAVGEQYRERVAPTGLLFLEAPSLPENQNAKDTAEIFQKEAFVTLLLQLQPLWRGFSASLLARLCQKVFDAICPPKARRESVDDDELPVLDEAEKAFQQSDVELTLQWMKFMVSSEYRERVKLQIGPIEDLCQCGAEMLALAEKIKADDAAEHPELLDRLLAVLKSSKGIRNHPTLGIETGIAASLSSETASGWTQLPAWAESSLGLRHCYTSYHSANQSQVCEYALDDDSLMPDSTTFVAPDDDEEEKGNSASADDAEKAMDALMEDLDAAYDTALQQNLDLQATIARDGLRQGSSTTVLPKQELQRIQEEIEIW
ncbi:hypothetical protein ON010_g4724 [Phytophthora cinnamomi]|nr:hypothetical protein ON010_g4724 [Phytophthora cinnamomi]